MQAKLEVRKVDGEIVLVPLTGIDSADVLGFDAEQFYLFNQDLVNKDGKFMVCYKPINDEKCCLDVVAAEMSLYDFINYEYEIAEFLMAKNFVTPQIITFR